MLSADSSPRQKRDHENTKACYFFEPLNEHVAVLRALDRERSAEQSQERSAEAFALHGRTAREPISSWSSREGFSRAD